MNSTLRSCGAFVFHSTPMRMRSYLDYEVDPWAKERLGHDFRTSDQERKLQWRRGRPAGARCRVPCRCGWAELKRHAVAEGVQGVNA